MEMNNKKINKPKRNRRFNGFNNVVTKQQVKQMIESKMDKVQDKYLTTAVYDVVVPASTGTLVQPALPAQGAANGQREGDSLSIDVIEANLLLFNIADSTTIASTADTIRVMCVQARANTVLTVSNASSPTTGVLDYGSTGAAVDINSFVNLNASNELFHVLHDKCYPVNYLSDTCSRTVHLRFKPAVSKINFTPGTTTSMCGGIFWIVLSVEATAAYVSMVQRLVYHDLN
jgi:hypothetical protein